MAALRGGTIEEGMRLWQEAHDLYVTIDVLSGVDECVAHLVRLARLKH